MSDKNTYFNDAQPSKHNISQAEMMKNVGLCYIVKKSYKRSDLPIYREIHRIQAVISREDILLYLADIISIEDKKGYVSIINKRRVEIPVAVYADTGTTLIGEKNYLEIVKYYQVTMKSMFRHMDLIITEQLVKTKKIKAILNGTLS